MKNAGVYWAQAFTKRLYRYSKDHNGVRKPGTVFQEFYRWRRCWNGLAESGTVPKVLRQCFRVCNGAEGPAAVYGRYNTVTEPGMLPKTLRHRYESYNFKDNLACLTRGPVSGQRLVVRC